MQELVYADFGTTFLAGDEDFRKFHPNGLNHRVKNHWVLQYTYAGQGWLLWEGRKQAVPPGHAILVQPGAVETCPALGPGESWHYCWSAFLLRPHLDPLISWIRLSQGIALLHVPGEKLQRKVCDSFSELIAATQGEAPPRATDYYYNLLEKTLLWLDVVGIPEKSGPLDERVRRAILHMELHYAEKLTMQRIAEASGASPSHLSHLFRDETGESPISYLGDIRIRQARRLLESTRLTVSEIAGKVGYAEVFQFSRAFSRSVGKSPTEYREQRHG